MLECEGSDIQCQIPSAKYPFSGTVLVGLPFIHCFWGVLTIDIVDAGGGSNLMIWIISASMEADHVESQSDTF